MRNNFKAKNAEYSQLSFYSGHLRHLELVSSLATVRNSGSLFRSNVCNLFFFWDSAAVRIIGVSVIAMGLQGEIWLYCCGGCWILCWQHWLKVSLQASFPIWGSEANRPRTREWAAKRRTPFPPPPPPPLSRLLSRVCFSRYTPNGELVSRLTKSLRTAPCCNLVKEWNLEGFFFNFPQR